MNHVKTTKIGGGADYALVPARLKQFREDNPRAKTETEPKVEGDLIIFKAYILKDKSDPNSADATGHSMGKNTGNKAFEKLETVALGRALAQLGYLNNGEIATTEEMEEFNSFKENQINEAIIQLNATKTLDELKSVYLSLGNLLSNEQVIKAKDIRKAELTNENN
jgi:hypothetical protein